MARTFYDAGDIMTATANAGTYSTYVELTILESYGNDTYLFVESHRGYLTEKARKATFISTKPLHKAIFDDVTYADISYSQRQYKPKDPGHNSISIMAEAAKKSGFTEGKMGQ